jgi:hypothetical protein
MSQGLNISVPISGGAAAPSMASSANRIGFGNVLVNGASSGGLFWIAVLGVSYIVWKKLTK